jgi:lysophospholipase L1-like esterase
MNNLVLLGDSIFDNAAYVASGPSVIQQLKNRLPETWQATLLAVDGHTSVDAARQLVRLPPDATHLVLSVGGNDALGCVPQLEAPTANIKQGLMALTRIRSEFEVNYQRLIAKLVSIKKPLLVCTIYDQVPGLPPELRTALGMFNDVILKEAIRFHLPVLDLRMICTEFDDYSEISPIEPSAKGGEKIAESLTSVLLGQKSGGSFCMIYT